MTEGPTVNDPEDQWRLQEAAARRRDEARREFRRRLWRAVGLGVVAASLVVFGACLQAMAQG